MAIFKYKLKQFWQSTLHRDVSNTEQAANASSMVNASRRSTNEYMSCYPGKEHQTMILNPRASLQMVGLKLHMHICGWQSTQNKLMFPDTGTLHSIHCLQDWIITIGQEWDWVNELIWTIATHWQNLEESSLKPHNLNLVDTSWSKLLKANWCGHKIYPINLYELRSGSQYRLAALVE